jgi:hypothetical protein
MSCSLLKQVVCSLALLLLVAMPACAQDAATAVTIPLPPAVLAAPLAFVIAAIAGRKTRRGR